MSEQKYKDGDVLSLEMINNLPHPLMARLIGGFECGIETVCVQTGCVRFDVAGLIDLGEFSDISMVIDGDGGEHNPDDFWVEL